MIARLGKGNFSHAALVLGPFVRFDATGKGIGFRVAAPHRVGHHLGRTRLVEDLSRFAGVRVLRHPGVAALPQLNSVPCAKTSSIGSSR
jgi:hypothetical protein